MQQNNPLYIIVHCSDVPKSNKQQFWSINRYHKSLGFPVSTLGHHGGYQILVNGGKEYRYREDYEIGAHCNTPVNGTSMNLQSLGLCWGGDGDIEFPDDKDVELMRARIQKWQAKYNIPSERVFIEPHRHWNDQKTCYGSLLADDWALQLVKPTPKPPSEEEKREELLKLRRTLLDQLLDLLLRLKIALQLQVRKTNPPK